MLLPKLVTTLWVNNAQPLINRVAIKGSQGLQTSALAPLIIKNVKPVLSLAHRIVPMALQNQLMLQALKQLTKEFMDNGDMDFMEGRVACLNIKDMAIRYYFTLKEAVGSQQKKLIMLPAKGRPVNPDVTFSASLEVFVLLASQKVDPDTLFFNRSLQISGDTELGLEIKNLIDQFDIQLLHKPVRHALNVWSQQLLENQHA